ncbi:MAG TPA: adenylosuccinate synthetase, partial [Saprospiraceae bacterium]|nr:adenylosuccinate synthetase [Saprospiraceae bacterium]
PQHIGEVIGITKAYCTRVGSGPFPTELNDDNGEMLRIQGAEFGSTTGRPRRCGWIDLVQLNYTIMLNGVTQLVMTKIDVLEGFDAIEVCTAYEIDGKVCTQIPYEINDLEIKPLLASYPGWKESIKGLTEFNDLPKEASDYLLSVQSLLQVPFSMISTGPERESLIFNPAP